MTNTLRNSSNAHFIDFQKSFNTDNMSCILATSLITQNLKLLISFFAKHICITFFLFSHHALNYSGILFNNFFLNLQKMTIATYNERVLMM